MAGAAGGAGSGAGAGGISGCRIAAGDLVVAATTISRRGDEVPAAGGALRGAGGFSRAASGDQALHFAEWRDQRRCIEHIATHSRQPGADARLDSEGVEANIAVEAGGSWGRLRHAAERTVRDSGSFGTPSKRAGCGARSQRDGADDFR